MTKLMSPSSMLPKVTKIDIMILIKSFLAYNYHKINIILTNQNFKTKTSSPL
jgi:hypothetical protein